MVRPHRTAILATAIPPTLLAIATVVADISLFVGFGLVAAAILSSVVFAIMRKWEIAKGTGFGSGIGLVVFIIYFVVLSALYG